MEHNNCRSHQPVEASFPKPMRITREIEKNPQHLWFLVLSPKSSLDKPDPASTARFVWLPPDIHLDLDLPVDGNHFSNSTSRRSDCQVMSSWHLPEVIHLDRPLEHEHWGGLREASFGQLFLWDRWNWPWDVGDVMSGRGLPAGDGSRGCASFHLDGTRDFWCWQRWSQFESNVW